MLKPRLLCVLLYRFLEQGVDLFHRCQWIIRVTFDQADDILADPPKPKKIRYPLYEVGSVIENKTNDCAPHIHTPRVNLRSQLDPSNCQAYGLGFDEFGLKYWKAVSDLYA